MEKQLTFLLLVKPHLKLSRALKFDQYDLIQKTLSDREFMLNEVRPGFEITKEQYVFNTNEWTFTIKKDATTATGKYIGGVAGNIQYNTTYVFVKEDGQDMHLADTKSIEGIKKMQITFNDAGEGSCDIFICDAATEDLTKNTSGKSNVKWTQ